MKGELKEASGELELYYEWEESASSHREKKTRKVLFGKGKNVELEITTSDQNAYKPSPDNTCQRFSIPVDILIKFIQEKGKERPKYCHWIRMNGITLVDCQRSCKLLSPELRLLFRIGGQRRDLPSTSG